MRIIADQNIPFALEAFGTLGEVETMPGRQIAREHLAGADALIVRSITRVDAALLEGTPVRFVGTCTIGEDHVDKAWLAERGIGFASAPGCNANSVSEYVVAALLELDAIRPGASLGVVGFGHVGRKVAAKARALGLRVVVNDPPLEAVTAEPIYRPLAEALACDVVTLHVPFEKGGEYPTRHLANETFLAAMKPGGILINTSRGGVADSSALLTALGSCQLRACVLDVWEGEPKLPRQLLERAALATPHIAGYSFDGKVNGTEQIYRALCAHLKKPPTWDPAVGLPAPEVPEIYGDGATLRDIVRQVYDIRIDDAGIREALALPDEEQPQRFDQLRKEYRRRREWRHTTVRGVTDAGMRKLLEGLGFRLD
ncbi:MAG: Erythronate-4-phosphate dehydrogenase [Candidatus Hydrogenedentota bacterium]|jgi:erythronate-4-phosphate dehydrogenase